MAISHSISPRSLSPATADSNRPKSDVASNNRRDTANLEPSRDERREHAAAKSPAPADRRVTEAPNRASERGYRDANGNATQAPSGGEKRSLIASGVSAARDSRPLPAYTPPTEEDRIKARKRRAAHRAAQQLQQLSLNVAVAAYKAIPELCRVTGEKRKGKAVTAAIVDRIAFAWLIKAARKLEPLLAAEGRTLRDELLALYDELAPEKSENGHVAR